MGAAVGLLCHFAAAYICSDHCTTGPFRCCGGAFRPDTSFSSDWRRTYLYSGEKGFSGKPLTHGSVYHYGTHCHSSVVLLPIAVLQRR